MSDIIQVIKDYKLLRFCYKRMESFKKLLQWHKRQRDERVGKENKKKLVQ